MTNQDRERVRAARDAHAREQQSWWDEFEASLARPSDPAIEQLDELHDLQDRSAA